MQINGQTNTQNYVLGKLIVVIKVPRLFLNVFSPILWITNFLIFKWKNLKLNK